MFGICRPSPTELSIRTTNGLKTALDESNNTAARPMAVLAVMLGYDVEVRVARVGLSGAWPL